METSNMILELPSEVITIEPTESNEPIKAWSCSVCGMDEWCGTEGCPGDPT